MSGRLRKSERKRFTIEELAIKHLMTHENDKSMSIWAKMNGTYGRQATREAIKKAAQVLEICDPNFKAPS